MYIFIYKCLRKIKSIYYLLDENFKKKNIIFGTNCKLHPESIIDNLQEREKLMIGKGTHIRGELFVYPYGNGISIGDNSYVGKNTVIRSGNRVSIGNNVLIAHNVTILDTDSHEIDAFERAASYALLVTKGHPQEAGG